MSEQPAGPPPAKKTEDRIVALRDHFLGKHLEEFSSAIGESGLKMSPAVWFGCILPAFRERPELLDCDPKSLLVVLLAAANAGFTQFNGQDIDAVIKPRNEKGSSAKRAVIEPTANGMTRLVTRRVKHISRWDGVPIFAGDSISVTNGTDGPVVQHGMAFDEAVATDWAALRGVYSIFRAGNKQHVEVMRKPELDAHRANCLQVAGTFSPWKDSVKAVRMALKTVRLRQCRTLVNVFSNELGGALRSLDELGDDEQTVIAEADREASITDHVRHLAEESDDDP